MTRSWLRACRTWFAHVPLALAVLVAVFLREAQEHEVATVAPSAIVAVPFTPPPAPMPLPPPIVASAAAPVAGWIVDTAGAPVADVRVTLRDPAGVRPDVLATSSADGAFRVEPAQIGGARTLLLDGPHVFPAEVALHAGPPPRILLARRASLVARVTRDGVALADVEVQITDGSRPTLATARSDRDGVVRFTDLLPGPYEVWARQGALVSPLVRVADVGTSGDEVALAVAPGTQLRGQVLTDVAMPAGASVLVSPIDVDHVARTMVLDAAGRFEVEGLPKGRWRVEATVAGHVQLAELIADSARNEAITLRVVRAGSVSGTVVDARGAPVANATIVLREQGAAAKASEPAAPTSSARLRWIHPLAGTRVLPGNPSNRYGAHRPGSRPAECGQGHCGIDLGRIGGTIIHASADGVVSTIHAESQGEAGRMVAIDHGDGLRTMYMHLDELRPGLEVGQRIRGGDPVGTMGTSGFDPRRSAPHLHFAITQDRGGRTWYLDPEPIIRHAVVLPAPRALDQAIGTELAATLRWRELGGASPAPTATASVTTRTTDGNGRFQLPDVSPGSYVAVAFATSLAPGVSAPFTVRTGAETGGVTITLRPGVALYARVLGRDGPIAGATVTASAGTGESMAKVATAYTDARGEATLRSLSGRITLVASAPGHGDATRTLALDEHSGVRREELLLVVEDAQLRGQVLAADGGAPGVVTLQIVEGATRKRVQSDASGRFTFERVASGSYVVEVTSAEHPTKRLALTTERYKELRLDAGGALRVEVRDTHSGAPMRDLRVEASGPGTARASRLTDATGVVELRGLPPGEWRVSARAAGFAARSETATVVAGARPALARLELTRGATLAGVVRDRMGRRVPGAKVTVGDASTITDAEGAFRLGDVPAGELTLGAELGDARGGVDVRVSPGDERLSLTIELDRAIE